MESLELDKQSFQSITHGSLQIEEIIALIKIFLEENPKAEYSLVIGTDSHEKNGTPSGAPKK